MVFQETYLTIQTPKSKKYIPYWVQKWYPQNCRVKIEWERALWKFCQIQHFIKDLANITIDSLFSAKEELSKRKLRVGIIFAISFYSSQQQHNQQNSLILLSFDQLSAKQQSWKKKTTLVYQIILLDGINEQLGKCVQFWEILKV